jgi:DUF177 domain-containing protein
MGGMGLRTDSFDLGSLDLSAGEARRLSLEVALGGLDLGGERYEPPPLVPVTLDVSRMIGNGYALRLRAVAPLSGPCMRCLESAVPEIEIDAREVDVPGGGEELTSPYLDDQALDLAAWAHDALVLALPVQVVCRPDCAGLCPECGVNLNAAPPGHHHDAPPDPRWAALRDLQLDEPQAGSG